MEHAILEANLGKIDTEIARLYLIDKIPMIDIATELDITRSTVSRRMKGIIERVNAAAKRIADQDKGAG